MKMKIILTLLLIIAIAFAGCTEESPAEDGEEVPDNTTGDDASEGRCS